MGLPQRTAVVGDVTVVAFNVTCRACRERVLTAPVIDDEAECTLRDHFMIAHRDDAAPLMTFDLSTLGLVPPFHVEAP